MRITTDVYPFQPTPMFYLYRGSYVASIILSNALANPLSPISITLPFMLLSVPQIGNVFALIPFLILETSSSHLERDLLNTEGARAQECTFLLKMALYTGYYGLVHCFCADFMSRFSTKLVISFLPLPSA